MTMQLTEANLRALNNEPSPRFPCPVPVRSPSAQLMHTKWQVSATINHLRRLGPDGLKLIREADVYIDETQELAYRGGDVAELDNPTFWERQLEILEPKYFAVQRACYGTPEPIVIGHGAKQDKIDEYYSQLKRRLEAWPTTAWQLLGKEPTRPPPQRHAPRLSWMKWRCDDDDEACSSASIASNKRRRTSTAGPQPRQTSRSNLESQLRAKRRSARAEGASRTTSARPPKRKSGRLAGEPPEYGMLP